jgi:hypothetical protein
MNLTKRALRCAGPEGVASWMSVGTAAGRSQMRVDAKLDELGLTLPEPQGPTWSSGIVRLGRSGA